MAADRLISVMLSRDQAWLSQEQEMRSPLFSARNPLLHQTRRMPRHLHRRDGLSRELFVHEECDAKTSL
jgi:hypothetical protein